MNSKLRLLILVAATAATGAAFGQSAKMNCQMIGNAQPEPTDGGRAIVVNNFSCKMQDGPLANAVVTASQIYEFDGPKGVGKAGYGVIRGADGMAVYVNREMRADLQMTDGKVTGAKGAGRGEYTLATGKAKSLEGKPYDYNWTVTGPGQFTLETIVK